MARTSPVSVRRTGIRYSAQLARSTGVGPSTRGLRSKAAISTVVFGFGSECGRTEHVGINLGAGAYNHPTLNNPVALASGSRLGPHEIPTLLGRGGMSEVYHARDTRLKRTVAIKVLPELLAG